MIDNQLLGLPAGQNVDINHQSNVLGKVTTQVTPQNNLMVQDDFNGQNRFFRRDNGYAFTTQDASWRRIETAHLIQGQWTSVLSKALFLDVRFGYLHQIFPLGPQSTAAGISKIDDILSTVSGSAPNYQTNLATGSRRTRPSATSTIIWRAARTRSSSGSSWHARSTHTTTQPMAM